MRIPYRKSTGRRGVYVPDVAVHTDPLVVGDTLVRPQPTIYEIKPRSILKAQWHELEPKFRAGHRFCKETGFRFRLLTDAELNPAYVENITFLLMFRGPRFMQRTRLESDIIKSLMDAMFDKLPERFTPNQLLDAVGESRVRRSRVIPWMWNLYSDYVIQCDMLRPMTMETLSWRCGDQGDGFPSNPDWRRLENDWRR